MRLEKINLTSNIRLFLRVFISRRKMSKYFDIGANLTDPVFNGIYRGKEKHPDDFEAIMSRAKEIGMKGYLVTGGTLEGTFKKLDFSVQFILIFRSFKIFIVFSQTQRPLLMSPKSLKGDFRHVGSIQLVAQNLINQGTPNNITKICVISQKVAIK